MAFLQHSLMLAGHFSLHFIWSARFSLAELFAPLTSATTARVLVTSSPLSTNGADLLPACLAIGPDAAASGLDVDRVDAALLDLPSCSAWNRFL